MIETLSHAERSRNRFLLSASEPAPGHRAAMELHDRIRAARTAAGLSQRQLARMLGVSASAVAQWELDETKPTHEHVVAIAAATNTDAAQIFGITTETTPLDADLQALITHWKRVPPDRRSIVLRLILAATQDASDLQAPVSGKNRRMRKPPAAA